MSGRKPYSTLDGSLVEELIRPEDGSQRLSLAKATLSPHQRTLRHIHHSSDEVYFVLAGAGQVVVGGEVHEVGPGHVVFIPAGTEHFAQASEEGLVLLCCCSPPYQHWDTALSDKDS